MFTCFITYYIDENWNLIPSEQYKSFNIAKSDMNEYIERTLGISSGISSCVNTKKEVKYVTEADFDKIKESKNTDAYYVVKMTSESIVYKLNTLSGTFYNSYILQKIGKFVISELSVYTNTVNISETKIKDLHVTNYERGAHVSFVSELKQKLAVKFSNSIDNSISPESLSTKNLSSDIKTISGDITVSTDTIKKISKPRVPINRKNKDVNNKNKEITRMDMTEFIQQLKQGKEKLKKTQD